MAGALSVEVVSRDGGRAWTGQAAQVTVPLADGQLGVRPGRQPVLAIVGRGAVRIVSDDGVVKVPGAGGFCSVDHDVITGAGGAAGGGGSGPTTPASTDTGRRRNDRPHGTGNLRRQQRRSH